MRDAVRQVDLEPVGRIVAREVSLDALRRPVLELGLELALRHRHAPGAIDLGEAASQHRLGLVIERAQKLRFPAVPHPGADRADVGGGKDREELHALQGLHHGSEILDRLAI